MFIPLKMVLIGIDPSPYVLSMLVPFVPPVMPSGFTGDHSLRPVAGLSAFEAAYAAAANDFPRPLASPEKRDATCD